MNKRDYFAGIALGAVIKNTKEIYHLDYQATTYPAGNESIREWAVRCYEIADAMVEASEKSSHPKVAFMDWWDEGRFILDADKNPVWVEIIGSNVDFLMCRDISNNYYEVHFKDVFRSKQQAEQYVKELSKNSENK